MKLDAIRKRPRFNISREEFQRRIREQLYLKCTQLRHLARNYRRKYEPKGFNAQAQQLATDEETCPLADQT